MKTGPLTEALREELHLLCLASLRDELTDDQAARLESLVCENPAARRYYVRAIHTSQSLRTWALGTEPVPTQSPATSWPSRIARGIDRDEHPARFWAVTAAVWAVFVSGFVFAIWSWRQAGHRPIVENSTPVAGVVAKITGRHLCQWENPDEAPMGDFLHEGTRLELTAGMLEITYDAGVRVVLESPATYTVSGVNRGDLQRGKLFARVLAGGKGFVVDVPRATVTDLGTEFGAGVDDENETEVYVFAGAVEIGSRDGNSTDSYRLSKGDSAHVDARGKIVRRELSKPPRFARVMPKAIVRSIAIKNASFERPALKPGEEWRGEIVGWSLTDDGGGGVSSFGAEFQFGAPDGRQTAFLHTGRLTQELDETLTPNTQYRLTVWVGNRPGAYRPNYTLRLFAGETELTGRTNDVVPAEGQFAKETLVLQTGESHAALGQPLAIVLQSNGGLGEGVQNHFDDMKLTATTYDIDPIKKPEPQE